MFGTQTQLFKKEYLSINAYLHLHKHSLICKDTQACFHKSTAEWRHNQLMKHWTGKKSADDYKNGSKGTVKRVQIQEM